MLTNACIQALLRLDQSSPQFTDRLDNVIDGKEFDEQISSLQADDLMEVVDYLDKVPFPHQLQLSSTEPAVGNG